MATEISRGERALQELRPVRVLHPLLLALIPLCGNYAYGENAGLLPVSALARPALVLIAVATGLWLLFSAIRKDRYHGGLLASALIVPFIVVWGALEETIRAVIPLFGTSPRAPFYLALVGAGAALVAAVAYRYWTDRAHLRGALAFVIVLLAAGLLAATFLLGPMFGRRAAWLIAAYTAAAVVGFRAVWNYHGDAQAATRSLNWFAAMLLALYGAVLAFNRPERPEVTPPTLPVADGAKAVPVEQRPDIYLIALDGYARADVLRTHFAYNDMPFENEMKAMGFRIAERSVANYPQAVLSLAALLNADYLENLDGAPGAGGKVSLAHGFAYYHRNSVFDALRGLGYRIESFSPGLEALEPRSEDLVRHAPRGALGEFEMVLIDRTFASRAMQAYYYVRYQNPAYWRYSYRRDRVLFAFEEMARIAQDTAGPPRLIFANLLIPEMPYLFTRDGGRAQPFGPGSLASDRRFRGIEAEYRAAYLDQLDFTNEKLVQTAKRILETSKRPAVIIVVSGRGAPSSPEHQPGPDQERFQNLLMVRFPDRVDADTVARPDGWRDDLSLVNVFRVVLNQALDAGLPLLEDKTYTPTEIAPLATPAR
ncbi:MAG: hypothetical protein FJY92_02325 [Candidatus Hydrogenedentes bacterium]|nr:hypothetical protein [Candidatus Hydrogenedentota bacterium]